MTILEKIIARKKIEIEQGKRKLPVTTLEKSPLFNRNTYALSLALRQADRLGIIAEFKRKSPSRGLINGIAEVEQVTTDYIRSGASGLSVLTDVDFFGGSNENLVRARSVNDHPILRKEFIIDEYQILEAKALGCRCDFVDRRMSGCS
jgi:indole-3-glycerol phosphate synthase